MWTRPSDDMACFLQCLSFHCEGGAAFLYACKTEVFESFAYSLLDTSRRVRYGGRAGIHRLRSALASACAATIDVASGRPVAVDAWCSSSPRAFHGARLPVRLLADAREALWARSSAADPSGTAGQLAVWSAGLLHKIELASFLTSPFPPLGQSRPPVKEPFAVVRAPGRPLALPSRQLQ